MIARSILTLFLLASAALHAQAKDAGKPNIIVILADDVGYGDLGCYGATQIKTPHIDQLASGGLRFTDAYAPASVCTPTRYALLTGQYAWRHPAGAGILSGVAPLSISTQATTLPSVLKHAGYATGIVGKWHLGLGSNHGDQNWNGEITPGPLEVGFNDAFFIPATGDRVPCVFIENHRVVGLDPADPLAVSYGKRIGHEPTGADPQGQQILLPSKGPSHNQSLVHGIPRIGFMTGAQNARWVDEKIPTTLVNKAVTFIESHQHDPFFLYFASHDIHAPRVANAQWKGSSQAGVRGDVVQQFDWQVGEILATLDRLGLSRNTLVIVSSDNGGTSENGYQEGERSSLNGHRINGALRGEKGSLYEGGVRVPMIARWPDHIHANQTSAQIASLVDLTATAAAITGITLPADDATDSFNLLPLLESNGQTAVRDHIIVQQNGVQGQAIRKGSWKLIPSAKGDQLFDLSNDLAESHNLASDHPDLVKALADQLARARTSGRTRP